MATKEEYIEKIKEQLSSWDIELGDLEAKATEATGELKAEIEEQMANIRASFRESESKIDELIGMTGDAWDKFIVDAEPVVDKLVEEFKEDIEYATTEAKGFVDKIKSIFK